MKALATICFIVRFLAGLERCVCEGRLVDLVKFGFDEVEAAMARCGPYRPFRVQWG